MILQFDAASHKYTYRDPEKKGDWTGVTTFIGKYKAPFDAVDVSEKSSRKRNGKWAGLSPARIREIWKEETKRSTDTGSWYHDLKEKEWLSLPNSVQFGAILNIFPPITSEDGYKLSPNQRLVPGIYPEHLVYMESAKLCGQSDMVMVDNDNYVHVEDYKTNKEIKKKSFVNWEGKASRMMAPLTHLDDCNFYHYALQLSMYMYMILKHNPKLKPGTIKIRHVRFAEEGRDQYDFPILKKDSNGFPIVEEEVFYDVPYLEVEVKSLVADKIAKDENVELDFHSIKELAHLYSNKLNPFASGGLYSQINQVPQSISKENPNWASQLKEIQDRKMMGQHQQVSRMTPSDYHSVLGGVTDSELEALNLARRKFQAANIEVKKSPSPFRVESLNKTRH